MAIAKHLGIQEPEQNIVGLKIKLDFGINWKPIEMLLKDFQDSIEEDTPENTDLLS